MDTTKAITHVSLCAGYGGIDIGLSRAIPSLRTVAFSEIEAFACANLVSKMEEGLLDCAPIWTNLKTFPWAEFRDRVDILSGGYPCQPFSSAGKRLGTEDPRHLWPYIANGIRAMRPRLCFFENVEGHISLGLREVVSELEGIGYKVAWGIFSAREVGAPHQRKRVFIMAHLKCEGLERLYKWYTPSEQTQLVGADSGASCQRSAWEGCELANTLCNGSGEGWLIRQGADGAESVSNGESWGAWPSRPGQSQHGWEPPRVVSSTIPNPTDNGLEIDTKRTIEPSEGDRRVSYIGGVCTCEGASVGDTSHGSNGQHTSEQQGRDTSGRSSEESGAMGNGNSINWSASPEGWEHDSEAGSASERQTQPSLGRDAHGTTCGMDYAELQDADSAMRGDNIGTVDGAMAHTICGRGQQTRCECGCSEVDENQRREEGTGNQQAVVSNDKSNDGGRAYSELCVTCDNRTDELRLLGNGVVPATAERAFRTLLAELIP